MKSLSVYHVALIHALFLPACADRPAESPGNERPNIVLIMTDDQGYGDLGATGNPLIHTPRIDQLADESTQLTTFYVDPVCAPTRAALMTGKHYLRTGVWDTFNGGAIMDPDEITLAEILSDHGYETGIYGKWHLGDTYPCRPGDQGFGNSLIHKSGGIGQPGDLDNYPSPDSSYFNPVLYRNSQPVPTNGFCTDVFTDGALDFIRQNHEAPFFLYVAYNAPHTPLQVPAKYLDRYEAMLFEELNDRERRAARRVYAMVENVDDNVGRILDKLEEHSLSDHTIVIFMTDNGPVPSRYNAGLRGLKSSVYEGGIRAPFFIRYPEIFEPRKKVGAPVAHIDVLPTLLSLCGLDQEIPEGIDGMSFLPTLEGEDEAFQERSLYWQWARGYPERYANMAIRKGDYKLVGHTGSTASMDEFELFNLTEDPGEKHNLVGEKPDMARSLKEDLDDWYNRIVVEGGNPKLQGAAVNPAMEDPLVLSRNDAKGTPEQWKRDAVFSYWDVDFEVEGFYDVTFRFHQPAENPGKVVIKFAPLQYSLANEDPEAMELTLDSCYFVKGRGMLEAYYREDFNQIIAPLSLTISQSD